MDEEYKPIITDEERATRRAQRAEARRKKQREKRRRLLRRLVPCGAAGRSVCRPGDRGSPAD